MATYESKKYATIPIAATQVADGSVTNAEYQFINTLASNAQTQITDKLPLSGGTITGDTTLTDNQALRIGTGLDLRLFHDGNNSKINNTTGELRISGDSIKLMNQAESETHLTAAADGAVGLRHNNVEKLATSATGVTVSGTLAATAVTGDGSGLTSIPAGPTGPPGGTGPTGPSGPTGPTGPAGTSGVPANGTAVGALKEFALYYKGSGGAVSATTLAIGAEVTPGTYDVNNMYLGVPEVITQTQTQGSNLSTFGFFRGYRANSDPTGKTRATETGTWRVVTSGYYFGGTTTGQNGITYHMSLAALFQRVA